VLNVSFHIYKENQELIVVANGGNSNAISLNLAYDRNKFHYSGLLKQVWGFGMIDRKTGRLIVKIVKKRNAETLIPIIQQWVSTDTEYIISDEW